MFFSFCLNGDYNVFLTRRPSHRGWCHLMSLAGLETSQLLLHLDDLSHFQLSAFSGPYFEDGSSFHFNLAFQAINLLVPFWRLCRIKVLSCPSPTRNQWKQLLLAATALHLRSALGLPGFSLHSPPAEALMPGLHPMPPPAFMSGVTNNNVNTTQVPTEISAHIMCVSGPTLP